MKKLILIIFVCLMAGCSEKTGGLPETSSVDNKEKWKILAPYIKRHFTTDMTVEEIAAELSYQEYLNGR